MTGLGRDRDLTPLQRAALAMREMRARLDRAEEQRHEGVAIVGIGCRFPGGASTPDEFWTLLRSGGDTVTECPRDRWDVDRYYDAGSDRPGTIATRHGSFLERVDGFDARFFDIPPSEAESLDPQQRLLLEVAWEALEHGGVAPDSLRGTRTGVFVGIGQNDYARRRLLAGDAERIGPYDGTGNGFCFAAGRLSYVLGLQGPNVAIDTACSASLVSVHLACQSLRLRECDLALAGGVQLMLSPEVTIFLSRAHALSPDGRCRTFDAGADGYGRGEGCGIVALKRLSDALRDRDHVYAVIRGSAVNHDGPSSGLTVPSAPAQQALIREALARAGLQPGDIDYLEAHGTATPLGDPIEIAGLAGVFGARPPQEPLRIGSVKTNLGHLEAAAGIAGLIKVVLALEHGEIPPHLHCDTPNPNVRWAELPFRVTRDLEPWRQGTRVRRAGVSAFGISGTNAHVVLEEAPPAGPAPPAAAGPYVLRLAAKSEAALHALAGRYASHVAGHLKQPLADVCFTANTGRADGPERAVVVGDDRAELVAGLAALSRGETHPPRVTRTETEWAGGAADVAADRRRVALPTYPWQRERHWIEPVDDGRHGARGRDESLHPLLHRRVHSPVPRAEIEFDTTIDASDPLVAQHRVGGTRVLPAAAFMEMALAAARAAGQAGTLSVETCTFLRPLELTGRSAVIRLVLSPGAAGAFAFEIFSAGAGPDPAWTRHASGRTTAAGAPAPAAVPIDAVIGRMDRTLASDTIYAELRERGLDLGRAFHVLGDVRWNRTEAIARLERRAEAPWAIDPALVDGCSALHAVLQETSGLWVQAQVDSLDVHAPLSHACWAYLTREAGASAGELLLLDSSGHIVLRAVQHLRPVGHARAAPRFYELTWIEAPHGPTGAAPAANARAYREAEHALDRLSVDFVSAALQELGGLPLPGGIDAAGLGRRLGIAPTHHRLLRRMLEILPRASHAVDAPADDIAARARAAGDQYPIAATEFELLGRCGSRLAAVLRGECEPLGLLFPAEGASAAALYSVSHAARVMNGQVQAALAALLASRPDARTLRVLEIGAGTGATTDVALDVLPPETEYWFTDVAPVFVQQARARFGDGRLRYRQLDVERSVEGQGMERAAFDIVIAANVVHATRSLSDTLDGIARLLRPGGSLVLLEGTAPRAWVDLIFGLTEGWWRFSDTEIRPSHPLVSVAGWRRLLERAGFEAPDAWPAALEPGPAGQSLIVAARTAADVVGAAFGRPEHADGPLAARAGKHPRQRTWLVVGAPEAARQVAGALTRRGARSAIVTGTTLDAIAEHGDAELGVVRLAAPPLRPDADGTADQAVAETEAAAALVLDVARARKTCPIWFVTRGLSHAPLWGIARTLALEEPSLAGGVIEAEGEWSEAAEQIAAELLEAIAGEDQVVYRGGARLVPRVRPVAAGTGAPISLAGGTYLITGGLGAFGLVTAEYLARRGARQLCLVGRRGAATGAARAALARLERSGVTTRVCEADVTNESEMRAVIDAVRSSALPLRGVVHAAGVTGFGLLRDTAAETFAGVLRPKVVGGWLLHRLTREIDLQFFVCYSSMVSVWGARGQGPYVAANHFLDALAHHRRAAGLPAVTINWGPLAGDNAGGGMVPEALTHDLLRMGVTTTAMLEAVDALDRLLDGGCAQPIVVDIDWARFRELYRTRRSTAMFDLVYAVPAAGPARATAAGRAAVLGALPAQRRDVLLDQLRALLARVITANRPIDTESGLFDLGLDSLSAMELRRLLEYGFGITLPPTLLFDSGTLEGLADDLLARLGLDEPLETSPRAAALDALTEDALEAQLLAKLQELNR